MKKRKYHLFLQNQHIKAHKKQRSILGATLREGAFAKVKVATQKHTGEKTAIKN